jgi:hypothetical protein
MDPDVCVTEGVALLRSGQREAAREYAEDLFDWLCKGGYYCEDYGLQHELLSAFLMDPTPTVMHWPQP